jgi:hypothetical protein
MFSHNAEADFVKGLLRPVVAYEETLFPNAPLSIDKFNKFIDLVQVINASLPSAILHFPNKIASIEQSVNDKLTPIINKFNNYFAENKVILLENPISVTVRNPINTSRVSSVKELNNLIEKIQNPIITVLKKIDVLSEKIKKIDELSTDFLIIETYVDELESILASVTQRLTLANIDTFKVDDTNPHIEIITAIVKAKRLLTEKYNAALDSYARTIFAFSMNVFEADDDDTILQPYYYQTQSIPEKLGLPEIDLDLVEKCELIRNYYFDSELQENDKASRKSSGYVKKTGISVDPNLKVVEIHPLSTPDVLNNSALDEIDEIRGELLETNAHPLSNDGGDDPYRRDNNNHHSGSPLTRVWRNEIPPIQPEVNAPKSFWSKYGPTIAIGSLAGVALGLIAGGIFGTFAGTAALGPLAGSFSAVACGAIGAGLFAAVGFLVVTGICLIEHTCHSSTSQKLVETVRESSAEIVDNVGEKISSYTGIPKFRDLLAGSNSEISRRVIPVAPDPEYVQQRPSLPLLVAVTRTETDDKGNKVITTDNNLGNENTVINEKNVTLGTQSPYNLLPDVRFNI